MDFMLSCKEVSRLMSQALDRKLTLRERLLLRFHLVMCTACGRVEQQFALLRRAISSFPGTEHTEQQPKR